MPRGVHITTYYVAIRSTHLGFMVVSAAWGLISITPRPHALLHPTCILIALPGMEEWSYEFRIPIESNYRTWSGQWWTLTPALLFGI